MRLTAGAFLQSSGLHEVIENINSANCARTGLTRMHEGLCYRGSDVQEAGNPGY